jgi:hypothetical protein
MSQRKWVFVQGLDSNGGDIGNFGGGKPVAEMIAVADATPGCIAFNTNGWYKNVLSPRDQWSRFSENPEEGMYVLEIVEDPPAPPAPSTRGRWIFIQGMDSGDGDIGNFGGGRPADEMIAQAEGLDGCIAFNTSGWFKNVLRPRSEWSRFSENPAEGMWVKRRWIFVQGLDSGGGDIGNFGGGRPSDEMIAQADSLDGCIAFNTNGWFKNVLLPRDQWSRFSDNPNEGMWILDIEDAAPAPAPAPQPPVPPGPEELPIFANGAFVMPSLNVSDVEAALAWFAQLGWYCVYSYGAPASFAWIRLGWGHMYLCRGSQGASGGAPVGPGSGEDAGATWQSWWMSSAAEVDLMHRIAVRKGIVVVAPPEDKPWGVRELRIAHPEGHVFRVCALL